MSNLLRINKQTTKTCTEMFNKTNLCVLCIDVSDDIALESTCRVSLGLGPDVDLSVAQAVCDILGDRGAGCGFTLDNCGE